MIRSELYDYNDANIHPKGLSAQRTVPNNRNKKVIFENWAPFINCISQINNTQVDDVHGIGVFIPMYNLTEYSNIYLKTSGSLLQY